jgi:hypothetical protein
MMTVVAFVRLIPSPPALVEIKKTWYAAERPSARRTGKLAKSYAISLVGTRGAITTCHIDKTDITHQSNIKVSPRSVC